MHKCILCNNSTTRSTQGSTITYHSFPRNLIRRNLWVENLKMDKCFDWQRICSDHFKDEDFKPGEKRLLYQSAFPIYPTNKLRPRDKPLVSNDTDNVNNTANVVISPRRSSRRKKKTSQLLDDENEEKTSTLVVAPTDSQTPKSNAKQKTTGPKKNAVYMHCSIIDCDTTYLNSDVSFFRFPEQSSTRNIWIECCGPRMTPQSKRKKLLKMCGKHFEMSMFVNPNKRNRLKPNAVPTLFINKEASNTSPSTSLENNNVASTSVGESCSSTTFSVPPSIELNENMIDVNMDDTNTNIESFCCIPGCISNPSEEENGPELIFLFKPPIEEISKWSSILGMQLAHTSLVCENHFKPQDIIHPNPTEKFGKKLVPGAVPLRLKPYEDKSENLLLYADPPNDVGHPALKLNDTTMDTIPQTMINSSIISQSSPIHNEHTSAAVGISDVDTNSILRKTLETKSDKIHPNMFRNSCVSITMESNVDTNKQISSDNSTEVLNTTSILKPPLVTEPDSILSASTSTSPQSNLIKILPKTFTDGSLSITMKPIAKQKKQLSEIDSTEINETISVDIPTFSTDNFISNSIESTFKDPILKNLVNNNSVSITREPSHKQSRSIPTVHFTDKFESTSAFKQIKNLKTEPTDILPTTDSEINFDQVLSDKLANRAQYTYSNTSINQDRSEPIIISDEIPVDLYDIAPPRAKKIKLEPINATAADDDEFPLTSTNNVNTLNSQTSIEMTENNEENLDNITLIMEISKTVVLPHAYWRSLYNQKQNSMVFIERNELMETVKKIYFKNKLVPIIYINYKRYNYNKTIDTTIALDNLLVEIDNIKICSGYDGYVHDYCLGYLEDSLNESEVCSRCSSLVEKECFAKFDSLISVKINTIQCLEKNIIEKEERILEIKKRLLQQNNNVSKNMYKSSNPVVCQR